MTALPAIPAGEVRHALDDVDDLRHTVIDLDHLVECCGGCGQLVMPNAIGLAHCGIPGCAAYARAEHRAEQSGQDT